MKRVLFSLLAVFAVGSLWADEVTVPPVEIPQGGVGIMSVNFKITSDIKYRDFQFDVNLPEGIDFVKNGAGVAQGENGDACSPYHKVTIGDRVLGFGFQAGITTDELLLKSGTLVNIQLTTTKDFENLPQELDATLTGVKVSVDASSEGATAYEAATIPFKIKIVENVVVLDENETELPAAAENVNVKVKRTIKANTWSTLCLPFDMTKVQFENVFGTDAKLAYFDEGAVTVEKGEGDAIENITIDFTIDDLSEGFTKCLPYVIKTSKDINEFPVDDVNIEPDEAVSKYYVGSKTKKWYGFYGTLHSGVQIPVDGLFLSENQFWYATESTKPLKGFRGYFKFDDVLTDKTKASTMLTFRVNGEVTAIDGINANQRVVEGVYDLQGRKVMVKDGDINNLQRGLYIINGKKVAIK